MTNETITSIRIFDPTSKKELIFAVNEVKIIMKGMKARSWNMRIPIAISPKKELSSPLSWIIFATSVVDDEERAMPMRKAWMIVKPKKMLKTVMAAIEMPTCSNPPKTINFFKLAILSNCVSKPTVNKRRMMPK